MSDMIPLDRCETTFSARRASARGSLEALQASIEKHGVLSPILAEDQGGRYRVIDGARRVRAARAAGLSEIPAELIDTSGEPSEQATELVSTTQGLREIERIDLVWQRCSEEAGVEGKEMLTTWKALAKDPTSEPGPWRALRHHVSAVGAGFPDSFLARALKLLKLDDELLESLRAGEFDEEQALALARVKDPTLRAQLGSQAAKGEISAAAIARAARDARPAKEDAPAHDGDPQGAQGGDEEQEGAPTGIEDIENQLEERIRSLPKAKQATAKKHLRAIAGLFRGD